jgi:GT2 family glycosyltransferase
MTSTTLPRVTAVILAYGAEEWLDEAVGAVLASTGVDVDLVLVDNGCTTDAVAKVKGLDRVTLLTPTENTGFAGGCNLGAAEATGDYLVFVNSDAVVEPDVVGKLIAAVDQPGVGMASASIRLAEDPDTINSAGNPLHYTGLSWSGGHGRPATEFAEKRPVLGGSGCCFAIRREVWNEFEGLCEQFFCYFEDTELSLRMWQRGLIPMYVPDAVVRHYYEFSRTPTKLYLLERNRELVLLTTYQRRTLILVAPMLLLTELAMFASAVAGGWTKQKVRGWTWILKNRRWVQERRALLQGRRTVPDADLKRYFTATFDAGNISAPPGVGVFNLVSGLYWKLVKRFV